LLPKSGFRAAIRNDLATIVSHGIGLEAPKLSMAQIEALHSRLISLWK